jgi:hypothetical protein
MSNLEALTALKISKLAEQKELSDRMSKILHGSMIPSQSMNNKNLVAAIAMSKKPGFFEYYQPSDEVKEFERDKVLSKLTRQIGKLHNEIVSINEEITLAMQEKKATIQANNAKLLDPKESGAGIRSLSQWIENYSGGKGKGKGNGEALGKEKPDMFSTFKPASKIYGGTAHHRSFKSSASTMTLGRMI